MSDNRQVLDIHQFEQGWGIAKYHVTWVGAWEEEDLVTAVDNRCLKENPTSEDLVRRHFGGYIEGYKIAEDEITHKGTVVVYYD